MKKNVGILIFKDVEVLDFAGPFEVFSVASEIHEHTLYNAFLVSAEPEPVNALNGMNVLPNHSFEDVPSIDLLVIAGGAGTNAIKNDSRYVNWIRTTVTNAEYVLSICSGARLLASSGFLKNKPFCTHHQIYDDIVHIEPTAIPQKDKRFVNVDNIYTCGGISAGIDLSFHVLKQMHGQDVVDKTSVYMEYEVRKENPVLLQ